MSDNVTEMKAAERPAPPRVRAPIQMAITWVCPGVEGAPCGFRTGLAAGPDLDKTMMAIASGGTAEKACQKCGAINELCLPQPPKDAPRVQLVRAGEIPGLPGLPAFNREMRRARGRPLK